MLGCLCSCRRSALAHGSRVGFGQWAASVPSSQFELADAVNSTRSTTPFWPNWERAKALLADRQWDEAVEILRQLAESSDGKLLGVTNRRYVSLREWCQLQLAALPPEALKLYRARVDPVAQKWYEQGIAERNRTLLQNVVEQAFASSYGDEALMALGEMALESGDYAAARWHWERILPATPPAGIAPHVARLSRHQSRPGGRPCPAGAGVDPAKGSTADRGDGPNWPSSPACTPMPRTTGRPRRKVRRSA